LHYGKEGEDLSIEGEAGLGARSSGPTYVQDVNTSNFPPCGVGTVPSGGRGIEERGLRIQMRCTVKCEALICHDVSVESLGGRGRCLPCPKKKKKKMLTTNSSGKGPKKRRHVSEELLPNGKKAKRWRRRKKIALRGEANLFLKEKMEKRVKHYRGKGDQGLSRNQRR